MAKRIDLIGKGFGRLTVINLFNKDRNHKWSEELGISYTTLKERINTYKWTINRALTTPVRQRRMN
jgi:KaiC/GvpD/RAD55 family RecA-like ATPase